MQQNEKEIIHTDANSNIVSNILFKTGWVIILLGLISGIIVMSTLKDTSDLYSYDELHPYSWLYAIIVFVSGLMSGLFFIGLAEIIRLLERIHNRLPHVRSNQFTHNSSYSVIDNIKSKSKEAKTISISGRALGNLPNLAEKSTINTVLEISDNILTVISEENSIEILSSEVLECSTTNSSTGEKYLVIKLEINDIKYEMRFIAKKSDNRNEQIAYFSKTLNNLINKD